MRHLPEQDFNEVIPLLKEDYSRGPIVRVRSTRIGGIQAKKFTRNAWVEISTGGKCKIYRQILGKSQPGLRDCTIAIDYDGRRDLGLEEDGTTGPDKDISLFRSPTKVIHVRQLHGLGVLRALCHHQDYSYRASMQIATVALVISIVGLVISILSIVFTFLE